MHELPPTGNTAQTRPENRAFYPALDGLRALAFLLVFGQHYLFLAWGWTGVNIFFVLSGFLITGILFDTRDHPHRIRNFYVRRSLRIFPLFYGLCALVLISWPLFHWRWSTWWLAWVLYLGNFLRFVSPMAAHPGSALQLAADAQLRSQVFPRSELYFGHLWSLCVEEQFYLVWPFVVFLLRDRKKLMWLCLTAVILGPLLRFSLQKHAPLWMVWGELQYRFTPAQADALLLGGLLALLWRGPHRSALLHAARLVALFGTVMVFAYFSLVLHGWQLYPGSYPPWLFTRGLVFVDWYGAAVMLCALQPGSFTYRLLSLRPLRWVGRLSYGAYIFHDLLHGLFVHVVSDGHIFQASLGWDSPQRRWATALLALPSTLLLAWLSFHFYESPFLDLKERWTRSSEPHATVPLRR